MVTEKCRDFSSRDLGYFRTASYARSLKRVSISSALMHTACMNACSVACDRTCALPSKNLEVLWNWNFAIFRTSVNGRIKMSQFKNREVSNVNAPICSFTGLHPHQLSLFHEQEFVFELTWYYERFMLKGIAGYVRGRKVLAWHRQASWYVLASHNAYRHFLAL